MKINERIYDYAIEENMLEVQEVEGHKIEIYRLNDYPDLLEEFTNKGKFAVWSCVDGKNYRLFIEEGYHMEVKELYSEKINDIWLKFWDKCEKIANKFRNIVMPLTIVLMAVVLLSFLLKNNTVRTVLVIVLAVAFLIGILIYRKVTNKLFGDANRESVNEIKKVLGEKKFERLLEKQRGYMDNYFKYEDTEEVGLESLEENSSEEVSNNEEDKSE